MSDMNLEKTLEKAQADSSVFKEIYDLTINRVYSFALSRVRNKDMALDICQNVYLDLWQYLPRFTYMGDAHFYAFLFKVARRQIIKARIKNRPNVQLEDIYDLPSEETKHEDYRVLIQNLSILKDKERMCIELRYFQDLPFKDISISLGVTENNAKVLHYRAIKKLQTLMSAYE